MGRLIDANKLSEEFEDVITAFENTANGKDYISKEEFLECLKLLRGSVDEQPTAYDVEKIVTELRKTEICSKCLNFHNSTSHCATFCDLGKKLEIVRKGGIDE